MLNSFSKMKRTYSSYPTIFKSTWKKNRKTKCKSKISDQTLVLFQSEILIFQLKSKFIFLYISDWWCFNIRLDADYQFMKHKNPSGGWSLENGYPDNVPLETYPKRATVTFYMKYFQMKLKSWLLSFSGIRSVCWIDCSFESTQWWFRLFMSRTCSGLHGNFFDILK